MLPESWIDRIFSKMQGRYGSLFMDRWKGCDLKSIKETWAEELAGFLDRPECLAYALQSTADCQFPPTLPEFIAAARRAPRKEAPALPHKLTDEERKHQGEMAKRLGDAIGAGKLQDGIDAHWATHPRSTMQLDMIFDAAKRDPRFQPCIEQMVADGICTAEGRLLKAYRNQQFERVSA